MQTEESRSRMRTFILLYILGLNICQASGQGNSTQMYYVKLTIEESAIGNITELLKPFVSDTTLHVDSLQKTTICQDVSDVSVCNCELNYRWSDEVCESNPKCCGNNKCTFPQKSTRMCTSNTTVTATGNITLNGLSYSQCLTEKHTEGFRQCNEKLLEEMKSVYSTLEGFDILTITKYRFGSIIAEFEMSIANNITTQDLIDKSTALSGKLSTIVVLETRGVVHLNMPPNPVRYNSEHTLRCTVQEAFTSEPEWQLKREEENSAIIITDGTGSEVTSEPLETNIRIREISELWEGEYTCVYHQSSASYAITHKASAVLDVCLKPNIRITTYPEFPHCMSNSDSPSVTIKCETGGSNEHFDVEWKHPDDTALVPMVFLDKKGVQKANIIVSCDPAKPKPEITCIFKNRCNQNRSASVGIDIIYENDAYCEAERDWKTTKAGFTAVLKCKDAAGQRQRKCNNGSTGATWEPEVSACVNNEVDSVLQRATVADIGLGLIQDNAAFVFTRLENITNNTQTINTVSNLNASVYVLFTLSQKESLQPAENTVDAFLETSSNMLDESLRESWVPDADQDNISMAERYLSSVEQLIQRTKLTQASKKNNVEATACNCSQEPECTNTVFGVIVNLDSKNPGSVKTAGFKELEKYLPNNDKGYTPNSIVVSTTTEREHSASVKIDINFPLTKPRPRNVLMSCVSWDNTTRGWSTNGCEWVRDGSSTQGHCTCYHLSSFAILISGHPLEVTGLTELTYVGLSVSLISLIISLGIELIVWSAVVKTNTLYLRHTAHVNISLCLLVADCCFLASFEPGDIPEIWCKTFVVLKHFCYLSMFFWMLCLSSTLLHQAVFLFHNVSKANYLRFSFILGYVCPLLIVAVTFLANKGGAEGSYFSKETCWLVYVAVFKGSIHTFVIPVGVIVLVNVFSMLVVIIKLLDHPKSTETSCGKEKKAALTVMRSVVLLTPIFGVTWFLGFAVMLLDLTEGFMAYAANYAFTLLNSFQGLFILLTTCLGDKLTRDALLNRLKNKAPASITDSSTKLDSTGKK